VQAVRTAMCSARGDVYWRGMSQPAKSPMRAPRDRWRSCRDVVRVPAIDRDATRERGPPGAGPRGGPVRIGDAAFLNPISG